MHIKYMYLSYSYRLIWAQVNKKIVMSILNNSHVLLSICVCIILRTYVRVFSFVFMKYKSAYEYAIERVIVCVIEREFVSM